MKGSLILKSLTVFFEIIFVLCFVGLTLRFFGIEKAKDLTAVFYIVGGFSFIISFILQKNLKKASSVNVR